MTAPTEDSARITGPAPGGVGLLIIDMINDFDFPGAGPLIAACEPVADKILALRAAADRVGAPTIYINDNFGHWRAERSAIVEHVTRPDAPGRHIVARIAPRPDDFFVIKPRFSGFYATNLQVLLPQLGVDRLVLTGVAADICVLFTAADAYMREYGLWVPKDAVASDDPKRTAWALEIVRNSMGAHAEPTGSLSLDDWIASAEIAR